MDPFSRIAHFYDRFAGSPQIAGLQEDLGLPPAGRLLDLGGGTGRVSQAFTGVQVVVCDLAAGMLRQARRKGLLVSQGSAEALPFPASTFDGVLVVDAFHHFADQGCGLREMLRVLRPAGRLVIVEPDIRAWFMPLVSWAERRLGLFSRMWPPEEMGALLAAAGGEVVRVEEDSSSYRLVARRAQSGRVLF